MLGAIIGDIVGSRFEFNNINSKDFTLFDKKCRFTDDTVLTVAVADCLMRYENDEKFKRDLVFTFKAYVKKYLDAGYGRRFYKWAIGDSIEPYGSMGNGSAMRVSPVGWYAQNILEAEHIAKLSAEVTHDHPDGIKGAVATAGAVYLANTGATKEQIKIYLQKFYPLDFSLEEWKREPVEFDVTCAGTVPVAMVSFLEANDYEDAIRNAVSVGGDSDTIAAITGGVAEAFFAIKPSDRMKVREYLPEEMLKVIDRFEKEHGLLCCV